MKKTKITNEVVQDYLSKGYHVHIRTPDQSGNQRISETILLVEIPYHKISEYLRGCFGISTDVNILVCARTFLSPRDQSNHHVSNKVVVGRIIRSIVDKQYVSLDDFHLCSDMYDFRSWLVRDKPPRKLGSKKISIFTYPNFHVEMVRDDILRYKKIVETETKDG